MEPARVAARQHARVGEATSDPDRGGTSAARSSNETSGMPTCGDRRGQSRPHPRDRRGPARRRSPWRRRPR
jgi:hypothetical protein